MGVSATSLVRDIVAPQVHNRYGVDLGYGGDSICPTAINIDLPRPYTRVGTDPQHLSGDCRQLHWFKDGVLDYVYSSHMLEDFQDIPTVLQEWARVLKTEGLLILCLPDEQQYRAHCKANNEQRNTHHVHDNLNLQMIWDMMQGTFFINDWRAIPPYSFLIISEKV